MIYGREGQLIDTSSWYLYIMISQMPTGLYWIIIVTSRVCEICSCICIVVIYNSMRSKVNLQKMYTKQIGGAILNA